MATNIVFNGSSYQVPAYGDSNWAQGAGNLSSYLVAIAAGTLQTTGGTFTLSNTVNFGSSFGLIAKSFTISGTSAPVPGWYSQSFSGQSSVTVTHNLGHYPIVQVLDNSGNLITPGGCTHSSVNAFTVTFDPALSGTILYIG